MIKRLSVHFSGRVQGVGFRYTAAEISRRYSITGYVKNLRDSRVELVAEGEEKDLTGFLNALSCAMSRYVRGVQPVWSEARGEFENFSIAF